MPFPSRLLLQIAAFLWLGFTAPLFSQGADTLSVYAPSPPGSDWLIDGSTYRAALYRQAGDQLVLSNGLIARTFTTKPNGATVALDNLMNGASLLRSVRPEAELVLNEDTISIGGLSGQPVHNYLLPQWIETMHADSLAFQLTGWETGPVEARFPWKVRPDWISGDFSWPPAGLTLTFHYRAARSLTDQLPFLQDIEIAVHYILYDGLPLLSKWISLENKSAQPVRLDNFKSEILAATEAESVVDGKQHWLLPNITVDTDYRFGGMSDENVFESSAAWTPDPLYATQVNYERQTACLLTCAPKIGPGIFIKSGERWESFRTWELIHDRRDREREGLAIRRMYRTIAPWVLENPVLMHVRQADDESVRRAVDQCAEVGFEMVIMTFGSGFNVEDSSAANLERMQGLVDYAHDRGIALGGYSLLASRKVGGGHDVVMPAGRKPRFGNSPCLESEWGRRYFDNLYWFYEQTGLDILEHDGSYPGDVCASTEHPGHEGLADSQWRQFEEIRRFYRWCRARGIYLNVPDAYFMNGSNKTGMGYRETNWSLPRAQQEIIERQNIYDGTWTKTPSMGWMFVPLVEYHGGGEAATIEPLREHLPHYEQRLANLFGAGVQACYRGPQLFDAPETKAVVQKWVSFYKAHRRILDSDVIHVRRPDGRDYDALLHVDPHGEEKGLLMVYNPLEEPIERKIDLDLYYTGLTERARVVDPEGREHTYPLDREYRIQLPVSVPARSQTWVIIK